MSFFENVISTIEDIFIYFKLFVCFLFKHWKRTLFIACLFSLSVYFLGVLVTILLLFIILLYYIYISCDYLLYNPNFPKDSRNNVFTPKFYGLDYEKHFLPTEDNVKIHVQLIKRSSAEERLIAPTFVYLHGNAGNIGHRLINAIELYRYIKCNILLVEYRGYGLSEGKPSEKGLYKDVYAALKFLHNRSDICKSKIILFGRSLGGAVAIGTTYRILMSNQAELIQPSALIIENTFTSVPDISRNLFAGNSKSMFARLFRIVPDWFYKSRYSSIEKISKISFPILFISGLSDELIPPNMMSKLFNKSSSVYKEIHKFESGTHNFTWKCNDYYVVIENFLKKALEMPPNFTGQSLENNDPNSTTERSPLISYEQSIVPTLPATQAAQIEIFHPSLSSKYETIDEPKMKSILLNIDDIIQI